MAERFVFRRPDGVKVTWDVEIDPGQTETTDNFQTRRGTYQGFPVAIRYAIGGDRSEFALENAIANGLRMLRCFGTYRSYPWEGDPNRDTSHPWELPRLFGYQMDDEQPFLVALEFGKPLAQLREPLSPDDAIQLAIGLARALYLLERLGITHRQLLARTVHWDARTRLAQINRFEYSRRQGEPRHPRLESRWASPEQAKGIGSIAARDDIYSAGWAILHSATGGQVRLDPHGRPDPAASGVPYLGPVLAGAFEPEERRPDAAELLRRLGQDRPVDPAGLDPDQALAAGYAEFDRVTGRRPSPPPAPPSPAPTSPVPPASNDPRAKPAQSGRKGPVRRGRRGSAASFVELPPSLPSWCSGPVTA